MKGVNSRTPVNQAATTEDYGEAFTYDPTFHGPVKERSCTDCICLCLFLAYIAGWAVIAVFAFRSGNPQVLIYPTDTEGNICGMEGLKDMPYLFFFDLTACAKPTVILNGCPTPQVCVRSCPDETFFVHPSLADEKIKSKLICKYGVDLSAKSVADLIKDNDCASFYMKSVPLIGRCIPESLVKTADNQFIVGSDNKTIEDNNGDKLEVSQILKATKFLAKFLSAREVGDKIFKDFKIAWHLILIGLVVCMVISFFWIILMRWVAGIMIWLSIFLVLGLSAFACYYCITMYIKVKAIPGSDAKIEFTTNLSSYLALRDTWLAFGIISAAVLLILLLVLLFLRKRIVIAIALIKEASRAVGCMMTSLIFPLLPFLLQIGVFAFWAAVSLYIASSGKATFVVSDAPENSDVKNGTLCNPRNFTLSSEGAKCLFQSYGAIDHLYRAHAYNLFGLFWAMFFIVGMGQLTLSGAFSAFYWTLNKKKDIPRCAVLLGLWRCIRYHLGSVAFGSLLIATVKMIRVTLQYIETKCKKYENPVTKAIMCCMKCCFWCLEKFLKFISKNAYIMMAVYGHNFCSSGRTAFKLLFRNILRVVVLDKVTDFLLLIGKLVVVGAAASMSFFVFSGQSKYLGKYIPSLNFYLLPVMVITFGAYIIATLFFNVYGMAVDTLFLCFLEDCERNDGSPEKPYHMSKELMKILDKRNKFRDPA